MKRRCGQRGICRFCRLATVVAGLLCAGLATGLAQTSGTPDQVARRVVVATKVAPPFAMKDDDGTWTGISIELWQHIADALHWQTTFQEFPSVPDMLKATADGKVDA